MVTMLSRSSRLCTPLASLVQTAPLPHVPPTTTSILRPGPLGQSWCASSVPLSSGVLGLNSVSTRPLSSSAVWLREARQAAHEAPGHTASSKVRVDLDGSTWSSSSSSRTREEVEDTIYAHVVKLAPSIGWNGACLAQAAREAGFPAVSAGVFERGAVDCVLRLLKTHRRLLESRFKTDSAFREMTLRQRLYTLIRARIEMVIPFKQVWPEALALLAQPSVLADSVEEAALLVDSMCHLAHDQSSDLSWYAKRFALLGIYTSTELYMLTDTTPGHQSTWKFLDRRLEDLSAVHGALERATLSLPFIKALPSLGADALGATNRASTPKDESSSDDASKRSAASGERKRPVDERSDSFHFGAFGGSGLRNKQGGSF
mmetsp:Transcript_14632/g.43933  ORF Transcript_14632/g.43933 Transcript_14632/m.43933 type:complete len:374 (-) Transcript_14632:294-1415(-)|eukprot:CAMPEP_0174234124 /NCGR_PEP_ID=MMETSP0417-20130205/3963_1 /TAXON_ID=242541 /ORGANISM="Mayorella sp, Strain BSH-02190019" /LENGTH=373 /DNA_ID=CAMNT_0015312439 /DNA_START=177 /DNA_END=1298 /DNA_ORIENTATION=+